MSWTIEGGRSGDKMDVTRRNAARVFSVGVSQSFHAMYRDNSTWTISSTQTPTAALDYFLYIQNTSTLRDLLITGVRIDAATAESVAVQRVTGSPASGTAIVPLNRSLGSATTPQGVFEEGVDITGLTAAGTFERILIPAGSQGAADMEDNPIILRRGTGAAVALLATTGAIALNFLVDMAYQTIDVVDLI